MEETLQFLYNVDNSDLKDLIDIITLDKNGSPRLTEELTSTDNYKKNYPNNIKELIPDMIKELENFGGNTFANFFRGKGKSYSYILRKVAKKLKVNFNKNLPDEIIEKYLLQKIVDDSLLNASDEELKNLWKEFGYSNTSFTKQAAIALMMETFRAGGFKSYIMLVKVVNSVSRYVLGRGLSIAGNAALTRYAAVFTGPIGWIAMGAWTVYDIAGPAYRVMIPAVIQIAYLREKYSPKNIPLLP